MALISITDYEAHADQNYSDKESDRTQINTFINQACDYIITRTGRTMDVVASPLQTVEIFSGSEQRAYWTKNAPIINIVSIEYYSGTQDGGWYDVDDENREWTNDTDGQVYFQDGTSFHKGLNNWRVTYTWGYILISEVPNDLKRAACLLVDSYQFDHDHQGIKSQSDGEQSFTYDKDTKKAMNEAEEIIESYIRY